MSRFFVTLLLVGLSACAYQKTAEEYGSSSGKVMFACAGETWVSQQFNEKFCLMRSVNNPNEYVLAEDTAEMYGKAVLNGLTKGLSTIFEVDIEEKWYSAAKEYAAEKHGTGARVINFRRGSRAGARGYLFEVLKS